MIKLLDLEIAHGNPSTLTSSLKCANCYSTNNPLDVHSTFNTISIKTQNVKPRAFFYKISKKKMAENGMLAE